MVKRTNGFTDNTINTLIVQNEMRFDADFDNQSWVIGENPTTDNLDIDRDLVNVMSIGTTQTTINGDLNVNGNIIGTTYVITQNLNVQDNLIELGTTNTSNLLNLGYYAHYDTGVPKYTGIIRDRNDGYTKVIDSSTEPTNSGAFGVGDLGLFRAGSIIYSQSATQATFLAESTTNNEAQLSLLNTAGSANVKLQATTGELTLGTSTDNIFINTSGLGVNGSPNNPLEVNGGTSGVMVVNNNGLVGIGTTTPAQHLDIKGSSITRGMSGFVSSSDTAFSYLGDFSNYIKSTKDVGMEINSAFTFDLKKSGTSALHMNTDRDIGIGTQNPAKKVEVNDSNCSVLFNSTDENQLTTIFLGTPFSGGGICKTSIIAEGIVDNSKSDLHFCMNQVSNNSTEVTLADSRVTFKNNGNVGIGVTNPSKNFEMNFTNASAMIKAKNENEDSFLYFSTPFQNTGVAKTAVIAEGQTSFSQSDLHFCLNNTNDNTTEVSLSDSRMVIKKDGEIRSQNDSFHNSTGGAGNVIAGDVPYTSLLRSASQSIPSGSFTTIDWDTTDFNRGTFSESSGAITVPSTGLYRVEYHLQYSTFTNASVCATQIVYNGVNYGISRHDVNPNSISMAGSATINVTNTGNTISLQTFHNEGANQSTTSNSVRIQLTRVGNSI